MGLCLTELVPLEETPESSVSLHTLTEERPHEDTASIFNNARLPAFWSVDVQIKPTEGGPNTGPLRKGLSAPLGACAVDFRDVIFWFWN